MCSPVNTAFSLFLFFAAVTISEVIIQLYLSLFIKNSYEIAVMFFLCHSFLSNNVKTSVSGLFVSGIRFRCFTLVHSCYGKSCLVTSDPGMYATANANIGPSGQTKQILKTI